jgi:energy-coupling factor transporter ATP-binding protein EcfA2
MSLSPLARTLLLFAPALVVGISSSTVGLSQTKLTDRQRTSASLAGTIAVAALAVTNAVLNNKSKQAEQEPAFTATKATTALTSVALDELALEQQKHPHIMLVGKTGGGKSTLAQYLAAKCPGKRFVIAPHYDQTTNDWSACHAVFCTGRNYGTPDDEKLEYAKLVAGEYDSPSAYQVIQAIVTELDDRYKSPLPQDAHECHNFILDETPAIGRALDKAFGHLLSPILFESRKVGIRLFVLTQSDNVETLKIKGQGKLRDQFTYIYLGDSAKARQRQLKRKYPVVEADRRWCVVDETPALIPDLGEIHATVTEAAITNRFIASAPEVTYVLPKPSTLKDREPTEAEWYALEIGCHELLATTPTLTDTQLAQCLGFKGEYYKRGKQLVSALRQRI